MDESGRSQNYNGSFVSRSRVSFVVWDERYLPWFALNSTKVPSVRDAETGPPGETGSREFLVRMPRFRFPGAYVHSDASTIFYRIQVSQCCPKRNPRPRTPGLTVR